MDLTNYLRDIKIIVLFIIFICTTGCSKKINIKKIVGKWYGTDTNTLYIFYRNNNCKSGIYDKKSKKEYLSSCTYKIKGNKVNILSGDEIENYKISFKNNNLVLTTDSNHQIIFENHK